MRWIMLRRNRRPAGWPVFAAMALLFFGCAHVPNQFREDGPAVTMSWDTPTAADVRSRVEPAPPASRGWAPASVAACRGAVEHEPVYFEDPFVDKGDGRTDQSHPGNVHRLGWEDYVAMPYCLGRHIVNWMFLPVSAVVTPPWTVMESDGVLSRQLLFYDHDATPVRALPESPPPPAASQPAAPQVAES